jgi:hypothetical protein
MHRDFVVLSRLMSADEGADQGLKQPLPKPPNEIDKTLAAPKQMEQHGDQSNANG